MNTLISRPRRCLGTSVGFVSEAAGPCRVHVLCWRALRGSKVVYRPISTSGRVSSPAELPADPCGSVTRRRGVSPLPGTGSARAVKKRHTRSSASPQPVSRRKSTSGRACSALLRRQPRSCTHLSPICRLPASQKWSAVRISGTWPVSGARGEHRRAQRRITCPAGRGSAAKSVWPSAGAVGQLFAAASSPIWADLVG